MSASPDYDTPLREIYVVCMINGTVSGASIDDIGSSLGRGGRARLRLAAAETRHTFSSIGSDNGASIEDLADAAGDVNANITRATYRHQLSDTVRCAPAAMGRALAAGGE